MKERSFTKLRPMVVATLLCMVFSVTSFGQVSATAACGDDTDAAAVTAAVNNAMLTVCAGGTVTGVVASGPTGGPITNACGGGGPLGYMVDLTETCPGPDGMLGTADDIVAIIPGVDVSVTVLPAAAPVFDPVSPSLTLSCGAAVVGGNLQYTNGLSGVCEISGAIPGVVGAHPGACGGPQTITWTIPSAINCGRGDIVASTTINRLPAPEPTFTAPPGAITVACTAVPAVSSLNYTNGETGDCEISGMVTSTQTAHPGSCGGTITETWTVPSAINCDRGDVVHTRTITVSPAPAPAPPTLANATVDCDAFVAAPAAINVTSGVGDCERTVTYTAAAGTHPGACGGDVVFTWVASGDLCGETFADITQTITISPSASPAFISVPGAITVACDALMTSEISYENGLMGDCEITGAVMSTLSAHPGSCGGTVTETWTIPSSVNCDRGDIVATRTITVSPATAPTPPTIAAVTVACADFVAAPAPVDVTSGSGDCERTVTYTAAAATHPGACGGDVVFTWVASGDLCGETFANISQTVTVEPAAAPAFDPAPAPFTLTCGQAVVGGNLPYTNGLSGACEISGAIPGVIGAHPGACGGSQTVTWTIPSVINCGRGDIVVSTTITRLPAPEPTFTAPPAATTVACTAVPAVSSLNYANGETGDCEISGMVTSTQTAHPGECGGTITETWTVPSAMNCDRGDVVHTRTITVSPAPAPTPPTIADATVACADFVAAPAPVDVTSGAGICARTVTYTAAAGTHPGACGGDVVFTWVASGDLCGETFADITQTITVSPSASPAFITVPTATTVACDALMTSEISYENGLMGNCEITGAVMSTLSAHPGSCGGTVTETWTIPSSVNCGRGDIVATRTITVSPAPAPTFTSPPMDITVQCVADIPAVSSASFSNSATGDCEIAGMVTSVQGGLSGGACGGTVTETWTISDATNCGRGVITHSRTITVDDDTKPMITCPTDFSVNTSFDGTGDCSVTGPILNPVPTDNCGIASYMVDFKDPSGTSVAGFPRAIADPANPGTTSLTLTKAPTCTDDEYTLTYTVTDNCGETETCSTKITLVDNEKPVVSGCPTSQTLTAVPGDCYAVATWTAPTATDNCHAPGATPLVPVLLITYPDGTTTDTPPTIFPKGVTTVLYTFSDCQSPTPNTETCEFTITVNDTENPTAMCVGDFTTDLGTDGTKTFTFADFDAGSFDNCMIVTKEISEDGATFAETLTFDCTDAGSVKTITLKVIDMSGNENTCTLMLTIPGGNLGVTAVATAAGCSVADGTATATPTGGYTTSTAGYSYAWSNGSADQTATGLAAATYTVTVTDQNGCTASAMATVTAGPANLTLAAMPTITNVTCNGGSDGQIDISVSGGTGVYTFAWSGAAQDVEDPNGLAAGMYSVTATDANGCQVTGGPYTVTEPSAVTATIDPVSVTNADCGGSSNGGATVTASGGTGTLTYLWSNGQTTAAATNLSAGGYIVVVTDANGCTAEAAVNITDPSALEAFISDKTNVSCFAGSDGSATVSATGSSGNYTYAWNGGGTAATKSGLSAGLHTVTVTDMDGTACDVVVSVMISEPSDLAAAIVAQTNVDCFGNTTGSATVAASGGTPTSAGVYTYAWPSGGTAATESGLAAGTYTVTVTDSKNCMETATVTVTQPAAALSAAVTSQVDVLCFGDATGSVDVTVSGGTGPYSYAWDGTAQDVEDPVNLTAGTYNLVVTDANGCVANTLVTITQPAAALTVATSSTNANCAGTANGTATATPSGGTAGYTYLWSDGQTTAMASNLTAGGYAVTVTDMNNCTAVASVTVTDPLALEANISATTDVSCNGGTNGAATVNASGGAGTYTYAWSASAGLQTTMTASNLPAGLHTVVVSDPAGVMCDVIVSVTILEPTLLVAEIISTTDETCPANDDGTATVNATGGTTGYTYAWSNGNTTATATGLAAGTTYTVTVTDANMCTTTTTATVNEPTVLSAAVTSQVDVLCFGDATGSVDVTVSGGTGPYSYAWDGTAQDVEDPVNLTAGTYNLVVTDANGCVANTSVTITQPAAALTVTFGAQNDVSCHGAANGSIMAIPAGGTAGYTYSWSNGQAGTMAGNLSGGGVTVTVTDANGCTAEVSGNIFEPDPLAIAISRTRDVSCFGAMDGSITVFTNPTQNGTPPYTYQLFQVGNTGPILITQNTSGIFDGLSGATYTVQQVDANGCLAYETVEIDEPEEAIATLNGAIICEDDANFNLTGLFASNTTAGGTFTIDCGTGPVMLAGNTLYEGSVISANPTMEVILTDGFGDGWTCCGSTISRAIEVSVAGAVIATYTLDNTPGASIATFNPVIPSLNIGDEVEVNFVSSGTPSFGGPDWNSEVGFTINIDGTTVAQSTFNPQPGNVFSITYTGNTKLELTPGTCTVTYTVFSGVCPIVSTADLVITPTADFMPDMLNVCADGGTINLNPMAPGGTWSVNPSSGGTVAGDVFTPSTSANGVYEVCYDFSTATNPCGQVCKTINVFKDADPTIYNSEICVDEASTFNLTTMFGPSTTPGGYFTIDCDGAGGDPAVVVSGNELTNFLGGAITVTPGSGGTSNFLDPAFGGVASTFPFFSWMTTNGTNFLYFDDDEMGNGAVPVGSNVVYSTAPIDITTWTNGMISFDYQNRTTFGNLFEANAVWNGGANSVQILSNTATVGFVNHMAAIPAGAFSATDFHIEFVYSDSEPGGDWAWGYALDNIQITASSLAGTETVYTEDFEGAFDTPVSLSLNSTLALIPFSFSSGQSCEITYHVGMPGMCEETATATLAFNDDVDPYFQNCPTDLAVGNDPSQCSAIVSWAPPVAFDNCTLMGPGSVVQTAGPASGSTFPLGSTTITYTATDTDGNTATCSFDVIVSDTEAPEFITTIPVDVTVECDAVPAPFVVTPMMHTADNCSASMDITVAFTQDTIDQVCPNTFTEVRTWTITDEAGNTASHVQKVYVQDTTAPMVVCQEATVVLGTDGMATITPAMIDNGSTDNCSATGNLSYSLDITDFDCNDVGTPQIVTLTVTDECGNSASCTATVTVVENPTIACNPVYSFMGSDPCVCKNNATNLDDGQFDELIAITAPLGDTWTVVASTGLFSTASAAPPATPIALPNGTAMTFNAVNNTYELTGIHVDAIGYSVTLQSTNFGTTFTFNNTCFYPTPEFTNLPLEFCLGTNVTFDVQDAFGSAGTTQYFIDGNPLPGGVFDASQFGLGSYLLTATFDAGDAADFANIGINGGALVNIIDNDPTTPPVFVGSLAEAQADAGCQTTIEVYINIVETPSVLVCNSQVNLSLDENCVAVVGIDQILEGTYGCFDDYVLTLEDPSGNIIAGNLVNQSHIGMNLTAIVTDPTSGNSCWGMLLIEDKLQPEFDCPANVTVKCSDDTAPLFTGSPVVTSCEISTTITHSDVFTDFGQCADPRAEIIRTWTVTDESGNSSTCVQTITIAAIDLADVTFPGDLDGANALECSDVANNPLLTSSANTGMPMINGLPITNSGLCMASINVNDEIYDICEGSYEIVRTWKVRNMCLPIGPNNPVEHSQVIKVLDTQGPSITPPADLTFAAGATECSANVNVPAAIITDGCASFDVVTITPFGTLSSNGGFVPQALDTGTYTITYVATDGCGNTSVETMKVTVEDQTTPTAVCDLHTVASIGTSGIATVFADAFDDGSFDNCSDVTIDVRKMTDACGFTSDLNFGPSVSFCCAEIGTTVMVEMRVTDGNGLTNSCMVEVEVQDKEDPVIICKPDITVSCDTDFLNDIVLGQPVPASALSATGTPIVIDNCAATLNSNVISSTVDNCGTGEIKIAWSATDGSGNFDGCFQSIFITDTNPFNGNSIVWPQDYEANTCGLGLEPEDLPTANGYPTFDNGTCSNVAMTHDDTVLEFGAADACLKILRKWIIIDWCTVPAGADPTDPNTSGVWHYTQLIKVVNSTAPVIESFNGATTIDNFDADCGNVFVAFDITASDDCTAQSDLEYTWEFSTGTSGSGQSASGSFANGTYSVTFTVNDQCGNATTDSRTFTVADKKKPTPVCIFGIATTVMPSAGAVTIWASDFESGSSYDNCTAYNNLIFSFSPVVPGQAIEDNITIACADIPPSGLYPITLYVTDEAGNSDFCSTFIDVQDPNNICLNGPQVAGVIETEFEEAVEEVTVTLSDNSGLNVPVITGADGTYQFNMNFGNYDVSPEKDINYLNGVTTIDILKIQQHILGLEVFNSPYKWIAADVNKSGTVTGLDMVKIRRLILLWDTEYADNNSWRFVDMNYTFQNPLNPLAEDFPEIVELSGINPAPADFVGVKIGDVNGSASPNSLLGTETRTFDGKLAFQLDANRVPAGEQFTVDFKAKDFNSIQGYQFTLGFDNSKVEYLNIATNLVDLNADNFGLAKLSEGAITTSWNESKGITLEDNEVIFSVTFNAIEAINTEDVFHIETRYTTAEAYKGNDLLDVVLEFNGNEVVSNFELYQNTPNPFNLETAIGFNMPQAETVTLKIYDVSGRVLKLMTIDATKGYNSVNVKRAELDGVGVLYYQLETTTETETKKLIILD